MLIIDCPELEAQIRREYGTLNMLVNNDFMMEQTKMDSVASYVKEQTKIAKKYKKKQKQLSIKEKVVLEGVIILQVEL